MTDVFGQQGTAADTSEHNVISFIIQQALGRARVAVPAKVTAVHGGGIGAPPTVDVQVLVNAIDGVGNQSVHGTTFAIPVFRLQGGKNAIIVDPLVGDVGYLVVSDRDISAFKANAGAQSNPGSYRRNSLSDAVYFGGIINPANPNQYVQFTSSGVKVFDKNGNKIEMDSSGIKLTATTVTVDGNLNVTGDVVAGAGGADSVGLQTHKHSVVTSLGAPTPPTPGT